VEQFIIYVLGAFSLILVITLASMDYSPSTRARRRVLREVFAPLVGVLIGSALTIGFTLWTSHNTQQTELMRATTSVDQEVETDIRLISEDMYFLTTDDVAIDRGEGEVVQALSSLLASAGETAYLHGSFDPFSKDLTIRVGNVYSAISVLNKRIDAREMYRVANQSMDNYHHRRRLINSDMEVRLQQVRVELWGLHLELVKVK